MIAAGIGKGIEAFEADPLKMESVGFYFGLQLPLEGDQGFFVCPRLGNEMIEGADEVLLGDALGQGLVMKHKAGEKKGEEEKPKGGKGKKVQRIGQPHNKLNCSKLLRAEKDELYYQYGEEKNQKTEGKSGLTENGGVEANGWICGQFFCDGGGQKGSHKLGKDRFEPKVFPI